MRAVDHLLADALQSRLLPFHRIGDGVAEHVEEGGLEEGVELGEGLAALGPQGVRRIQNRRNPLLLGEGREGDLDLGCSRLRQFRAGGASNPRGNIVVFENTNKVPESSVTPRPKHMSMVIHPCLTFYNVRNSAIGLVKKTSVFSKED